uniref:Uncharacterized protein n=1 Tax=Myoviridae sp. ctTBm11 TaxID=2825108 RepID=A0A8S5PNY7_9CAUD|nr:MAG TPA: hypothetical protein [Myoviridae sp. ctTBm11]
MLIVFVGVCTKLSSTAEYSLALAYLLSTCRL